MTEQMVYELREGTKTIGQFSSKTKAIAEKKVLTKAGRNVKLYTTWVKADKPEKAAPKKTVKKEAPKKETKPAVKKSAPKKAATKKEITRAEAVKLTNGELIEEILFNMQADNEVYYLKGGHVIIEVSILDSDPEHCFDDYRVKQADGMNIVDVTEILADRKKKLTKNGAPASKPESKGPVMGADGRYLVGGDTHVRIYQYDYERMKAGDDVYNNRHSDAMRGWEFFTQRGNTFTMEDYKM